MRLSSWIIVDVTLRFSVLDWDLHCVLPWQHSRQRMVGDGALSCAPLCRHGCQRKTIRFRTNCVRPVSKESLLFQLDWTTACIYLERGKCLHNFFTWAWFRYQPNSKLCHVLISATQPGSERPYNPENIPFIVEQKNIWQPTEAEIFYSQVLPIALLIMGVVTFKTGLVSEMFNWSMTDGYIYLPSWVREIGSMMQIMPLLIIPFVGIIQTCRYFLHGPDNILEVLIILL